MPKYSSFSQSWIIKYLTDRVNGWQNYLHNKPGSGRPMNFRAADEIWSQAKRAFVELHDYTDPKGRN